MRQPENGGDDDDDAAVDDGADGGICGGDTSKEDEKQTNKLPPNRTTTFAKIAKRNYKNILDIFASLRRMGLRSVDRQPKNVNTSCTFLSRDT